METVTPDLTSLDESFPYDRTRTHAMDAELLTLRLSGLG